MFCTQLKGGTIQKRQNEGIICLRAKRNIQKT